MLTNREQKKQIEYIANADIPMMMIIGWGIGFLISGILLITVGAFADAGEDEIWSLKSIFAGILAIGISVCIGLIAKVYWRFSQRKSGTLFPRLNGFGVILAIVSTFSGAVLGMIIFSAI